MKTGTELIAEERARQINQELFWPERDTEVNKERQLASAALSYLAHYVARAWTIDNEMGLNVKPGAYQSEPTPDTWPDDWAETWWKPKGKIEDLKRAGALIAAEIDRLQGS